MKKFVNWSVLLCVLLSLTACAAVSGGDPVKAKCPSCGYDFEVDLGH